MGDSAMTDIVKRLRAEANALGEEWPDEAADEIERLRDEVNSCRNLEWRRERDELRAEIERLRDSHDEWKEAAEVYAIKMMDERERCARIAEESLADLGPGFSSRVPAAIRGQKP